MISANQPTPVTAGIALLGNDLHIKGMVPFEYHAENLWGDCEDVNAERVLKQALAEALTFQQHSKALVAWRERLVSFRIEPVKAMEASGIYLVVQFSMLPKAVLCLTVKEREVIAFTANGVSTRQIAENMGVAMTTVNTHRARAREKLEVASNCDLVRIGQWL